ISGADSGNYLLSSTTAVTTANITSAAPGTVTWTGAVSTDWNNPLNWDTGVVPSADDKVIIPQTINQPQLSGATTIQDLSINSGETFSTGSNPLTVTGDITLGGTLNAGSSIINISGNFIATGSSLIGINPTLQVGGYIGTPEHPIDISVSGTLNITAGGMSNRISVVIKGGGLYNFQGSIPGFVFADGNLKQQIGQSNFRASLSQQQNWFFQPAFNMQRTITFATAQPLISAGPQPTVTPMIMTVPVSAISPIPVPALPVPDIRSLSGVKLSPKEVIPPALLFKEVIVSAEVLKLSSPETFREMKVTARISSLANFREAVVYSNISRIVPPDVFRNIKIVPQVAEKNIK
ncbi:MAG: hypothetical protein PHY35_05790, partial [Candidatus Omnitrophica bacterium]|nr:hypothetical protein [Candidatus Omnitrophota bacterium]